MGNGKWHTSWNEGHIPYPDRQQRVCGQGGTKKKKDAMKRGNGGLFFDKTAPRQKQVQGELQESAAKPRRGLGGVVY